MYVYIYLHVEHTIFSVNIPKLTGLPRVHVSPSVVVIVRAHVHVASPCVLLDVYILKYYLCVQV